MAPTVIDPKAANIWTARIIPLILIGIVGYVTWVVIVLVCVDYLLRAAGTERAPRQGTAIALIVIYSILLLLIAFSYFRLLYTVASNPGFVPRGPRWHANKTSQKRTRQRNGNGNKTPNKPGEKLDGVAEQANGHNEGFVYPEGPPLHEDMDGQHTSSNLSDFYTKDVFSCEGDGRPIWCSTCLNFKPDRAHHCREVGRCVRKMDHFCPWVGGVVSETSFKFFVQFLIWASVYWVFNLVMMAIFVAEMKEEANQFNVNWVITLAFGGLLGLFALGMTLSSMQFVCLNTTTIENLGRRTKVWTLAIHIPSNPQNSRPPPFHTVTYPLGYVGPNQDETLPRPSSSTKTRTFAILHTKPGENPWDLGYWRNFKSVMGEHWYDWLLPIRYSPCCDHERYEAQFEPGPVVQRMKEDAGLVPLPLRYESEKPERRRRRKRRRRGDPNDEKSARSGYKKRHHKDRAEGRNHPT